MYCCIYILTALEYIVYTLLWLLFWVILWEACHALAEGCYIVHRYIGTDLHLQILSLGYILISATSLILLLFNSLNCDYGGYRSYINKKLNDNDNNQL